MNRRDLLKALASIVPAVTVKMLPVPKPDDLIVLECPGFLTEAELEEIARQSREFFGRGATPVLVLSEGVKLKVVSRADVRGVTKDA